jgi:DNA polymerase-3 subunit gamma/tau
LQSYPAAGSLTRGAYSPGVSLYRTWRPRTFDELVGQEAVVRTLTGALAAGRLVHAYLFAGPRGSGKTSAAKIMARCICCERGPTPVPDNTCAFCAAILEGTALDVLEIDAASNRGIDEIRSLRESVKFAPSVMRKKVYIVDEAHMLTKEGANAFLKTLEEPPPHAVFILCTTEPEKLPVTILSRCQRYTFRRIGVPVMLARMRAIADAEGIAIADDALATIAYRADGGLRDALTMLEQAAVFAQSGERITAEMLASVFGTTGREASRVVLEAALRGDLAGALRAVAESYDAGHDMHATARALAGDLRALVLARIDPSLLERDLAPEDAARMAALARESDEPHLIRGIRLFTDAAATTRLSGNPRVELECALLRWLASSEAVATTVPADAASAGDRPSPAPTPAPPARKAPQRQASPERRPASTVAPAPGRTGNDRQRQASPERRPASPTPAPSAAAQPGSASLSLQKVRAAWGQVRKRLEREDPPLRILFSRAQVADVEGETVALLFPEEWMTQKMEAHRAALEAELADVLGSTVRVRLGSSAPVGRGRAAATPQAEPEDDPDDIFRYVDEKMGTT